MRVLVVEDDPDKLDKVSAALSKVEGMGPDGVTVARDVISAKKLLSTTAFDVMVLDLVLPLRPDRAAEPDAGVELLDAVFEDETLKMPGHIIGLTAFESAFEAAAAKFASRQLSVLSYAADTADWVEFLQARVSQVLAAARARGDGFGITLGIVCALQTPEFEAVRSLPWQWKHESCAEDHAVYWRGSYTGVAGPCSVVAVVAPRMGLPACAVAASKLVARFRPKFLSMTGICAGVRTKAKAGHVIVADPVWDYGSGKWIAKGKETKFLPAPHQLPLDVGLRGYFERLRGDAARLALVKASFPGNRPDTELALHVGPFASGAAVAADGDTIARATEQHRQLLGIDMEAYALYLSAEEAAVPRPVPFVVKSVVDHADNRKGDEWQRYGAHVSAHVLRLAAEEHLR